MRHLRLYALLSICGLALSSVRAAELNAEDKLKITQALPAEAAAKPKRPRKLLLLNVNVNDTGRRPDVHVSLPFGDFAIVEMGKKTRAYETVLRTNIEALDPGNLKQFDAICFNNTTGVLTTDERLRQSLLSYVAGGKGFIAFHAGGGATFVQYPKYDQFPEFGVMVGGYENGGPPWNVRDTVYVRVDDPKSPVTAAFHGQEFPIQEEVYQFQEPYSREKVHVLLSIDLEKSDYDPKKRHPLQARAVDKDFANAWIKTYHKGRVFYSAFGHNPLTFENPQMLKFFLAGIQYALGDLKADDRPSAVIAAKQNGNN